PAGGPRRAPAESAGPPADSQVGDLDRLARRGAPGHRLGELHVAHPVLERRAGDFLGVANRADELLFDPPADPPLGGDRDLTELRVATPPAGEAPGVGLEPERALAPEDPHLARRGQRGDRAEPEM